MFNSNNSYFRIVAHNPHTRTVKSLTDTYNLQDETIYVNFRVETEQPIAVVLAIVQSPAFEMVVTEEQCTMTFNNKTSWFL